MRVESSISVCLTRFLFDVNKPFSSCSDNKPFMKKERYLQIFNYLLEFSKLRSNPVRDIESSDTQYPDKIWFADIPQYDIFDCITFPNYNQDADY